LGARSTTIHGWLRPSRRQSISLAVSLILVNFAIGDGKTQYLEGYVLMVS
jgi:Ca2+/H+ antiporter